MNLSPLCCGKLFAGNVAFPEGIEFAVTNASFDSHFGSKAATLTAKGDSRELQKLFNYIGYGTQIVTEQGDTFWTGIINRVTVTIGGQSVGITLDDMANKVAVQYSAGNDSHTTDWSSNSASIAYYGITKQYCYSASKAMGQTEAEYIRGQILNRRAWSPKTPVDIGETEDSAQIELIGLSDTLDWLIVAQDEIIDKNTQNAEASGFDWMTNRVRVNDWTRLNGIPQIYALAQKFTAADTYFVGAIEMYCGGVGSPPGGLRYEIWTYVNASPVAGSKLCETDYFWTGIADFKIASPTATTALTKGASYWLIAQCGGYEVGTGRHWVFGYDPAKTANLARYYDDTGFHNVADLPIAAGYGFAFEWLFRIYGYQEHTQQIGNIIDTVYATNALIADSEALDSTGLVTTPKIQDNTTAKAAIENLMNSGTSNGKRLLGKINAQRVLQLYEEPGEDYANAPLHLRGTELVDRLGNPVDCDPCGQWCVADALSIPGGAVINPCYFLIDAAEWDGKQWRLTARDVVDPVRALGSISNA